MKFKAIPVLFCANCAECWNCVDVLSFSIGQDWNRIRKMADIVQTFVITEVKDTRAILWSSEFWHRAATVADEHSAAIFVS